MTSGILPNTFDAGSPHRLIGGILKALLRRFGVVVSAAILLGAVAVVASATGSKTPSGIFRYSACLQSSTKTLVNVVINRSVVCSSGERAISWNAAGPRGATGAAGTNGSSIITSSSVPSGPCTTGNSDVDLTSGEVYACTSSDWSDAGFNLKGSSGARGPTGPAGPAGPLEINALSLVDSNIQLLLPGLPLQLGSMTGEVGSSVTAGPNVVTFATAGSYLVTVSLTVSSSLPPTTYAVQQNGAAVPGFTGVIDSTAGSVTVSGIVTASTGDTLTVVETAPVPGTLSNIQVTITQLS